MVQETLQFAKLIFSFQGIYRNPSIARSSTVCCSSRAWMSFKMCGGNGASGNQLLKHNAWNTMLAFCVAQPLLLLKLCLWHQHEHVSLYHHGLNMTNKLLLQPCKNFRLTESSFEKKNAPHRFYTAKKRHCVRRPPSCWRKIEHVECGRGYEEVTKFLSSGTMVVDRNVCHGHSFASH